MFSYSVSVSVCRVSVCVHVSAKFEQPKLTNEMCPNTQTRFSVFKLGLIYSRL